jgi:hypothetical protein
VHCGSSSLKVMWMICDQAIAFLALMGHDATNAPSGC